jgi:hypothetical protein
LKGGRIQIRDRNQEKIVGGKSHAGFGR